MRNEIILTYDGTLAPSQFVSLRTLSYTLPHLQRAIDKTVYFQERSDLRKYTSLPEELHVHADLYFNEVIRGSLRIPFISELLEGVPELFTKILENPYERAAGEVEVRRGLLRTDLEITKEHARLDNLEGRTQEDVVREERKHKLDYARSAVLHDVNNLLSVVRSDEGAIISLSTDTQKLGYREFYFDRSRAYKFSKITNTKRLADPVIYTGKIKGVEEQRNNSMFKYAAKFLSSHTNQESKLLIADIDDALKISAHNLKDENVVFWGAPIALFDAFDPVRGDVVFIDFIS